MLSLDQILERNPELIHANIDDETMLMSITNGEYYGMNSVGSTIWELLEKSISVEELIKKLTTKYGIDTHQCEKDITVFLNDLLHNGIVNIKD